MSEKVINEIAISQYFTIIQNVITRMAQNSFLIKAWSVTIFAGLSVITYTIKNHFIFIILLGAIIILWILDSYYLWLERLFRRLYNKKVEEYNNESESHKMKLFEMNYRGFIKEEQNILRIMVSKSEILFYLPLMVIISFIYFLFTFLT